MSRSRGPGPGDAPAGGALELLAVTVSRGAEVIVRDLTLRLAAGRPFWVVGPNGAGKSSLLRVLAGLDRPAKGRVRHRIPPGLRLLYFHSEMRIPGSATVGDWSRLAGRLLAPGDAAATTLRPDLDPGRRVGRLSTGERKRLLLDVLLRAPGPVILDEPFEHLSPDARDGLAGLLSRRAAIHPTVVATNRVDAVAPRGPGLRLEGGMAVAWEGGPEACARPTAAPEP